ncbi:hypothetical protein ACLMLE_28305, partial [Lysobacter capsici]
MLIDTEDSGALSKDTTGGANWARCGEGKSESPQPPFSKKGGSVVSRPPKIMSTLGRGNAPHRARENHAHFVKGGERPAQPHSHRVAFARGIRFLVQIAAYR